MIKNRFDTGTLVEVLAIYSPQRTRKGIIHKKILKDFFEVKMLDCALINVYHKSQIRTYKEKNNE